MKRTKFLYRWREVSTSEFSKLLDVLAIAAPLGRKSVKVGLFMAWTSACLVCKFSSREGESRRVDQFGLVIWGWKDNFEGSKCVVGIILSVSANRFRSSFSSLRSLTFSSCLNLSCRRAIEELTMVGSLLCLPILHRDLYDRKYLMSKS